MNVIQAQKHSSLYCIPDHKKIKCTLVTFKTDLFFTVAERDNKKKMLCKTYLEFCAEEGIKSFIWICTILEYCLVLKVTVVP